MDDVTKIKRALYLKGIITGKTVTIELTEPIGVRNIEDEYVHVAEKGDHVQATMKSDSWSVDIPESDDVLAFTANIPLANGKVR